MSKLPTPIFQNQLPKIFWKKIFAREYGVQYSEMAILCLSPKAKYHIPSPSVNQVVVPEEDNAAFYIDENSWAKLVESLNEKYTLLVERLEKYEKDFIKDGSNYLGITQKIQKLKLARLTNDELSRFYLDYQEKLFRYSIFTWTAFILNNFVAERATMILEKYLVDRTEEEKQDILDVLFQPDKEAAVFKLQDEIKKDKGRLTKKEFKDLHEKYKWLSCLDLHNHPLTEKQFKDFLKGLKIKEPKRRIPFNQTFRDLQIKKEDFDYLLIWPNDSFTLKTQETTIEGKEFIIFCPFLPK